jgi:hypothetical protein
VVQRLDPVEPKQESQDHLLTPLETGKKGLGPGRIHRQDG